MIRLAGVDMPVACQVRTRQLHPPDNPHLPQADDLALREIEVLKLLHWGIAKHLAI